MTEQQKLLGVPKRTQGTLSRTLAILGFIILLVIVIWGLVHIATLSSPWFVSLFRQAPPATPTTIVVKKNTPTIVVKKEPATTTPTPSQKPQPAVTYSGLADLRVQIIFAAIDSYGNGIVQFDIANIGRGPSGTYYFQASLPTMSGYQYSSLLQPSLNPGDHIQNTLNFSQSVPGAVSVSVDPANLVREANETNNYASQTLQRQY